MATSVLSTGSSETSNLSLTTASARTRYTAVYSTFATQSVIGTGQGTTQDVVTVTETSVEDPTNTVAGPPILPLTTLARPLTVPLGPTPSTDSDSEENSEANTTKMALGFGISLGIILVALVLAGGYFWGKRASRSARKARGTGETDKNTGQEATERHELTSGIARLELPTRSNITEMPEQRPPLEMPPMPLVELPASERGNGLNKDMTSD